MNFLRHRRSIIRWRCLHRGRSVSSFRPRLLIVSMSRSRLFLGGLRSRRAHLRFTGCRQNAVQWYCWSSILQRTAMGVLTGCDSQGVKPRGSADYRTLISRKLPILKAQVSAGRYLRPNCFPRMRFHPHVAMCFTAKAPGSLPSHCGYAPEHRQKHWQEST